VVMVPTNPNPGNPSITIGFFGFFFKINFNLSPGD